ncbi:Uncharacterized protein APZ42_033841 [Daphnia magna]|uniref:RNA-directed DNA polymerase n=1 Tax=Daphnia magna TaxID=35525 RepID=A0A164KM90_9CRUS|nr:Uncharacterized protein APZ42_033841 [Daphnia magna]
MERGRRKTHPRLHCERRMGNPFVIGVGKLAILLAIVRRKKLMTRKKSRCTKSRIGKEMIRRKAGKGVEGMTGKTIEEMGGEEMRGGRKGTTDKTEESASLLIDCSRLITERLLSYNESYTAAGLLSKSESNYSITEKECLALVWAVKKFRSYIWGMETLVVTDHNALCWLLTKKDLAGRLARWSPHIQEFLLRIAHRNGRLHSDADALSRYLTDAPQELDEELQCMFAALIIDLEKLWLAAMFISKQTWLPAAKANLKTPRCVRKTMGRLRDGLLCFAKVMEDGLLLRLCVPQSFRDELMRACHHDITAGHLGLTQTLHKIQSRYYWPGMGEDIRDFLRKCRECQSRKSVYHRLAGFLEIERSGNTNIVVAIDYVTKWAETKALPRAGATEVADFLVKCVRLHHSAPHQLTTEEGCCFMAEVTQKVLQAMETNHTPTTAYRLQANGLVERLNHTLADMLSMYVSADHRNWDESLPFVTFEYNTSRQESTGRTPFYLVYERETILPVDGALNSDPNLVPIHDQDPAEWALERLQRARHEVQRLSVAVHEKQKIRYEDGCREAPTYLPGEKVSIYKPVRKVGKTEKLLHRWFGPYAVVRQTTPSNYELRRGRSPKSEIVHVERIKPFVDCVSPSLPAPVPTTTGGQPEESSGDPSTQSHADNREQEPPPKGRDDYPAPGLIGELDHTSAKKVVAYQGKIFKSESEVAFSDYEWVVATELTLNHMKTMMKTLRERLEVKIHSDSNRHNLDTRRWYSPVDVLTNTDLTIPSGLGMIRVTQTIGQCSLGEFGATTSTVSSIAKFFLSKSHIRRFPIFSRMQFIVLDDVVFGVRDKFKLTLQQHVKGRALIELGKLRRCNQRFSDLKAAVNLQSARRKRGLVDGGCKVFNWLFGVSTQEDLEHVHGHLDKLSTENTSIVHVLEVHASLSNETLLETKAVADALGVAREMETHWIAITTVEDAFRQVEPALAWLDEALNNISVGIANMSMGRLPVTLFPTLQVEAMLKEIKAVLPPGWSLSPCIQNGHTWKLYMEAKVVVATGRISLMGVHLRVIKEEEKARVAMEVDGTVGLRYPFELIIAIVGSLLGFAASLVFSWHNVTGGANKHIYTDLWGWQTPIQSRVPIELNAHECEKMRDSRLCHGKSMDYLGNNKWSFERIPNVQSSWPQVTADQLIKCRLEEVTLETECANCTISSPIGDIPGGINGSVSHNLGTIVWKESLREAQQCILMLVETCIAQRYLTNKSEIERIRDVEQQLDFVYNTTNHKYCNSSEKSYKQVIEMEKVILRLHSLTDTNAHPSKPLEEDIENIADILRAEISGAAHSRDARDQTADGINGVAREIRVLQCENRVLAHKTAIATAQHSGWLAASYLNLSTCSKLIVTGESISVYQCSPKNSTITTEIISCGPQPKLSDYTLDTKGWELTPYNPCYWHKNFVNINSRTQLLALSLHPALTPHPMSPTAAIADIIAAAKAEHSIDLGNPFHMSTLLSSLQKEKNVFLSSNILS